MSRLNSDIQALQDELPEYISWIERQDTSIEVYLANDSNDPFNLMLPDGYDASYPKGCVSCVCGGNFEELGEGTLAVLLERLNESMHFAPPSTLPTPSFTEAINMAFPRPPTAMSVDDDGMPRDESMMSEPDENMNPELERDIQSFIKRYGANMIIVEEMKLLDKVFVTLMLDLSYLSAAVCNAWGLAPKAEARPVRMKFHFSRSGYMETGVQVRVNCDQEGREWCGLAGQLEGIFNATLDMLSKQRMDDSAAGISQPVRTLMSCGFEQKDAECALHGTDVETALAKLGGIVTKQPKRTPAEKRTMLDEKSEKKKLPAAVDGLLVQLLDYAHFRVKTCPEFCVVCDQAHMFSSNMLKATVCSRDICAFAFQQLGVGAKAARDVATDAGVVDLLVLMARAAAHSLRWEIIFTPFPTIFDPNDPQKRILHPTLKKENINLVRKIFENFPSAKELNSTADNTDKRIIEKQHKWAYPLLQWILSSNTSHLVKLRKEQRIKMVHTPHQFLLVSAAPAKQERFDALKKQYKTTFAFHGSATENWHSMYVPPFFSPTIFSLFFTPTVCGMACTLRVVRSFR